MANMYPKNISEYLQPQYNLLACLRKGIIYHHGRVPDAIRIYIEDLYRNEPAIKYVITSSTLLSGVNLPAERMFILDNKRGRSNLSHDSFKNLVGRIGRSSEIFNRKFTLYLASILQIEQIAKVFCVKLPKQNSRLKMMLRMFCLATHPLILIMPTICARHLSLLKIMRTEQ